MVNKVKTISTLIKKIMDLPAQPLYEVLKLYDRRDGRVENDGAFLPRRLCFILELIKLTQVAMLPLTRHRCTVCTCDVAICALAQGVLIGFAN